MSVTTPGAETDPQPASSGAQPAAPVRRRRAVPTWVWVLLGVLVVAGVVAAVLAQINAQPQPAPLPPPAATVTLPPPSPTVDPIDPGDGTEFFDALPRTLLSYALATSEADADAVVAGALEAYTLTYTDGGDVTLTVQAAQYPDATKAEAALDDALAAVTGSDATPAPEVEEGVVEVDGVQVGRYVMVRNGEQGSVMWTNGTALLRLGGPADALRDAYAAFPL